MIGLFIRFFMPSLWLQRHTMGILRSKRTSFCKDAKDLVSSLRSVQSESRGRLIGRLRGGIERKLRVSAMCTRCAVTVYAREHSPDEVANI